MLTFKEFSDINLKRCEQAFHTPIKDWSETDWACAVAGETGEMCNLIKKRHRSLSEGKPLFVSVGEVGKELADIVTYVDLLATRLGLDLETILIDKFNEVSDRVGFTEKL